VLLLLAVVISAAEVLADALTDMFATFDGDLKLLFGDFEGLSAV
jgi:hypothetical protein